MMNSIARISIFANKIRHPSGFQVAPVGNQDVRQRFRLSAAFNAYLVIGLVERGYLICMM
jgi:hypothetical protein